MIDCDGFLLLSAEADGCYRCDPFYNLRSDIYKNIEDVVNLFHDMMEKKVKNDYPISMHLIDVCDGEILQDMQLGMEAGCLSGLYEVSFTYNGLRYRIKRGARKVDPKEKELQEWQDAVTENIKQMKGDLRDFGAPLSEEEKTNEED